MKQNLSKTLQMLREKNNWTKTYVAKRLGIKTLSTYANWEYGLRDPDYETLSKLAEIYDVSIDYLLGRTENPFFDNDNEDEKEFQSVINDPDLKRWVLELPETEEEDLKKLRMMWEIIKNEKQ